MTSLSQYEVLGELGSGGMGVVYKARDRDLGRLVALKLLRPDAVADAERRRRFLQEAKAASALNHPNIAVIYHIGYSADGLFIAMECVNGQTLEAAIADKPLRIQQAAELAIQVADALSAAHASGIIHRDIKPANLMVTPEGRVKVLDFGIAKLVAPTGGEGEESTATNPPQTKTGEIVGTVAYMSPEQACGRAVDARSDIFSFGTVLYQMVTGKPPFRGASPHAILKAIIEDEPIPPSRINPSLPQQFERIVLRCLEKDPAKRFQHVSDLRLALEWLRRDVDPAATPPQRRRHRNRVRTAAMALGILAAAVAGATAVHLWWPRLPELGAARNVARLTSDSGLTTDPALSRDGRLLAYASDRAGEGNLDIWVRVLAGGEPNRRTRDEADDGVPRFSPDGRDLVFARTGVGVFITPVLAGEERLIAPGGLDPRFSPDGSLVAYWAGRPENTEVSDGIFAVPPGGGEPRTVVQGFADARFPVWAPDGKHILFQGRRAEGDAPEWWVTPPGGGAVVNTGALARIAKHGLAAFPGPTEWGPEGVLFSGKAGETRHVWRIPLKPGEWVPDGPPVQLTFGTLEDGEPFPAPDGRVVFASWHYNKSLWRVKVSGGDRAPIERISRSAEFDTHPSISRDGRTLVFLSTRSGNREVWLRDLASSAETAVTMGRSDKSSPALTPDGTRVAYSLVESGKPAIYISPTAASAGEATSQACRDCGEPCDWTPDGAGLFHVSGRPRRVSLLDVKSGSSVPVLAHPVNDIDEARLSPDGRWISFLVTLGPDRTRIYVAPFRGAALVDPQVWMPVTEGDAWDQKPRWLGSDALVFYSVRDRFGCLWRQRLNPRTMRPEEPPVVAHHFHTLRLSPRTILPAGFGIAATRDAVILNMVEITGNIWMTDSQSQGR